MVTDQHVRRLVALIPREPMFCLAAAKVSVVIEAGFQHGVWEPETTLLSFSCQTGVSS